MLILSRQRDETIWIGRVSDGEPLAKLTITDIRGDKVRVGIEAPGLDIHRKEVWLRMQQEAEADHGTLQKSR